jgi:hypothetical protein
MASEESIIRNYAKTGIVLDELAIPNRTGNVDNPNPNLIDTDDKTAGYLKPVIFINGYFVDRYVMNFNLELTGILPVVKFKFYMGDPTFLSVNYPKDGDIISIYIRSNVPVYKPIRMDFNVLSVDSSVSPDSEGNILFFSIMGECRIPGFYTEVCKAYPNKTSRDTLFEVSQDLDLGFATNDSSLNDSMTWICPYLSYYNFIKEITKSSYKDDRSFYSTWVDIYYNLNFVNLNNQLEASDIKQLVRVQPTAGRGQADDTKFVGSELQDIETYLVVTNDPLFAGYPFFINGYTLISEAGNITNGAGYVQVVQLYNENSEYQNTAAEKEITYTIQATTTENIKENMVLQRGRASEKEYLREIRTHWMGILDSGENGAVHDNYLQARVQNPLNISDITKFTLQVETISYFPGFYRGQVIPVLIYVTDKGIRMENAGFSADQKSKDTPGKILDQFLSGQYILLGYTVSWSKEKGFYQILNLSKREWILNSAGTLPKAFPVNFVSGGTQKNNI